MEKPEKSLTLDEWLAAVAESAESGKKEGKPAGACLVTDPHTGVSACILVDKDTCKALRGTFVGGPCGALLELPDEEPPL